MAGAELRRNYLNLPSRQSHPAAPPGAAEFSQYQPSGAGPGGPRLLVIGANGEGKSNLLESVELLGCLRSHRTASDRDLIQHGQSSCQVRASTGSGDQLALHLRRSGGRMAQRNGKVLDRQLDLLGSLRCVGFSALDLELVRGEPAGRRQWLDRVVLQLEPVYGDLLSRYGRLLRQRSQLLRRGLGGGDLQGLLDAFDLQIAVIGTRLQRRRSRAIRRLEPWQPPGRQGSAAAGNAWSSSIRAAPRWVAKMPRIPGGRPCWPNRSSSGAKNCGSGSARWGPTATSWA